MNFMHVGHGPTHLSRGSDENKYMQTKVDREREKRSWSVLGDLQTQARYMDQYHSDWDHDRIWVRFF